MTQMRAVRRLSAWARAGLMAGAMGLATVGTAGAAQAVEAAPENVVSLSASASLEVVQDWLSVRLQVSRDGAELNAVQAGLKRVLDAALAEARQAAVAGQVEVRTGHFHVGPRYGRDGRISGWQGSAELILEGRDTVRLAELAGRLNGMAVSGSGYSVSAQAQEKVEAELVAQAIRKFRSQAQTLAEQFGFAGYTLREVNVQGSADAAPAPILMRSMAMASAEAAPLPVEAGKSRLSATVQGSVQLQRVQLQK